MHNVILECTLPWRLIIGLKMRRCNKKKYTAGSLNVASSVPRKNYDFTSAGNKALVTGREIERRYFFAYRFAFTEHYGDFIEPWTRIYCFNVRH